MYVPRLRRIETILKEIKQTDPKTVISRWFIIQLIRSEEITQLKYGDAWLILRRINYFAVFARIISNFIAITSCQRHKRHCKQHKD